MAEPAQTQHVPVMPREVVRWLAPKPGMILVDGTFGGGGHTRLLAERVGPDGCVIAVDRDPEAIERAADLARQLPVRPILGNFCDLPELLAELDCENVDGMVLDLGVSSDQLADGDRGFSFQSDGPLDLRFDPSEGEPAWRLLEHIDQRALADLIYHYGEERFSRRIAAAVVEQRRQHRPVRTAAELAELVHRCIPRRGRIDSATRTFQALRIAVNDELRSLEIALERVPEVLRQGARLVAISFHSLEDRRVKTRFREDPRLQPVTKKPQRPQADEMASNARSRSAKLRVAERV